MKQLAWPLTAVLLLVSAAVLDTGPEFPATVVALAIAWSFIRAWRRQSARIDALIRAADERMGPVARGRGTSDEQEITGLH